MASVWMEGGRTTRRSIASPGRIVVAVVLLLALGALLLWWLSGSLAPSRQDYPMQGVAISERNGAVEWPTLRADDVDFAYLAATAGADRRDPAFAANWAGAREAGLRYGAIHGYSLCKPASDQARLFIASVPRDNAALPPVVSLDFDAACTARPRRDALLAELNTFLAEIEAHSGKPAILRIARPFEEAYQLSAGINRTIWLERDLFAPDYAAHPWVLWTANHGRRLRGAEGTVEWAVVKP